MKLSAPIYVLKSQAKKLKKNQEISMNQALDLIAQKEGFSSWSLLMSKTQELLPTRYDQLMDYFNPGDLVLVGACPFEGKTTFAMGLFAQAIRTGKNKSFLFSLSEVQGDIGKRISRVDPSIVKNAGKYEINYSDEISADYIVNFCKDEDLDGSVIVIDYLQLLDQKREKASLQLQVERLKAFAKEKSCIVIFIAQLNREARGERKRAPRISDINLPNPLDLKLVNKTIFLHRPQKNSDRIQVLLAGKSDHSFFIRWSRQQKVFFDFTTEELVTDPYEKKVLETFFIDGRLTHVPLKRKKRTVILKYLLKRFESGRKYSEVEVNQIIKNFHEDYCLIRREFICEKMMARDHGEYWVL